jgi:hypothetical protein
VRRLALLAVPVLAAGLIVGCGGHAAPAKVKIHGSFAEGSLTDGNCGISTGDQVRITSGSGKLLAIASLGNPRVDKITVDSITVPEVVLPWSATVPAEAQYGLTVGGSTPYFASRAEARKGADLSC